MPRVPRLHEDPRDLRPHDPPYQRRGGHQQAGDGRLLQHVVRPRQPAGQEQREPPARRQGTEHHGRRRRLQGHRAGVVRADAADGTYIYTPAQSDQKTNYIVTFE